MTDKIEVTKEFLQRVEDALSINPTSAHGLAVRKELEGILGGWQSLAELRGRLIGDPEFGIGSIFELLSSDRRAGVLAVSVQLPNTSPADMFVTIDQKDGIPTIVDQSKFSSWRLYEEDPTPQ